MDILVTGGAGFIGSALCKELRSAGHDVTCLDNYHAGSSDNHHSGISYITGSTQLIDVYFHEDVKFDFIFHLGEYARVEQSFNDFDTVMEYNYMSFPKVVNFAKKSGAKLVYAGSSTKFSVGEDGKSMSPYAYTKAQNTEFLKRYSEWYGLHYTIVYFYNAYGDHEIGTGNYSTVIAKFIGMVKNGATQLPVTSPGTQLRNFTHVDDIVSGLILSGFYGSGDGYGIGCDEKHSILDLVGYLGAEPIITESVAGNRMDGELKTDQVKALGWIAQHNLQDYINEKFDL
tara:strand:+ start:4591 stop:5448 length:858 start_codon:yes stop_codon:yes gene_type:complete